MSLFSKLLERREIREKALNDRSLRRIYATQEKRGVKGRVLQGP